MEDSPTHVHEGAGLLPSRKASPSGRSFTAVPCTSFLKFLSVSMVSPYLAYAGWGGRSTRRRAAFQQALSEVSAKEFLDKFAEVLTKNMS